MSTVVIIVIVLVVCLSLGAGGAGYYFYTKKDPEAETVDSEAEPPPSSLPDAAGAGNNVAAHALQDWFGVYERTVTVYDNNLATKNLYMPQKVFVDSAWGVGDILMVGENHFIVPRGVPGLVDGNLAVNPAENLYEFVRVTRRQDGTFSKREIVGSMERDPITKQLRLTVYSGVGMYGSRVHTYTYRNSVLGMDSADPMKTIYSALKAKVLTEVEKTAIKELAEKPQGMIQLRFDRNFRKTFPASN